MEPALLDGQHLKISSQSDEEKEEDKVKVTLPDSLSLDPPNEETSAWFVEAATHNRIEEVKAAILKLKPSGEQLAGFADENGWTVLHNAARQGHTDMCTLFLDNGVKVDVLDKEEATPMYRAVGFGHLDTVKMLMSRGADPLVININQDNMLHNSAWGGYEEMTQLFIDEGVSLVAKDKWQRTPLMDLVENLPELAEKVFNELRIDTVSGYLKQNLVQYDFDGIDEQEESPHRSPLQSIVKQSELDLLSTKLIKKLLDVKWEAFGRRQYIQEAGLYVFALILFTYATIQGTYSGDPFHVYDGSAPSTLRAVAEILVVLFAAQQLWGEVREFRTQGTEMVTVNSWYKAPLTLLFKKGENSVDLTAHCVCVPRYLLGLWNYMDLTCYVLMILTMVVRAINVGVWTSDNDSSLPISPAIDRHFLAIVSCLFWCKFLQLAGIFRSTGPLIRMIKRMALDTLEFLVVYIVFLFGFASAFYILLGQDEEQINYKTFGLTLWTMFRAMLGDIDSDDITGDGRWLIYTAFILYMMIAHVMLLNLLIAMMSNSYEVVIYVAEKEWLWVRADYLLRLQAGMGRAAVQKAMERHRHHSWEVARSIKAWQNGPGAVIKETSHYCAWEPKQMLAEAREVNLQMLHDDLEGIISELREDIKTRQEQTDLRVQKIAEHLHLANPKPPSGGNAWHKHQPLVKKKELPPKKAERTGADQEYV